jgi:hypothetical protein
MTSLRRPLFSNVRADCYSGFQMFIVLPITAVRGSIRGPGITPCLNIDCVRHTSSLLHRVAMLLIPPHPPCFIGRRHILLALCWTVGGLGGVSYSNKQTISPISKTLFHIKVRTYLITSYITIRMWNHNMNINLALLPILDKPSQ